MKNIIFTLILIPTFFFSCQETEKPNSGNTLEDDLIKIQFTLLNNSTASRGVPAEEGESIINDLTLLFFDESTTGKGKYKDYYKVAIEEIPDEDEFEGDEHNQFSLTIRVEDIDISGDCNILAVANIRNNVIQDNDDDFNLFIDGISEMSENEVIQYLKMEVQGVSPYNTDEQYDNSHAIRQSNLLMSGKTSKKDSDKIVECKLERAVARFDVVNAAAGYKLVSASIWNAFPNGYVWDDSYIDYNESRTERFYGLRNEINGYESIHGGLYVFENISIEPEQLDDKTTCLILGLQPASSLQGQDITYYRVNVNANEKGQYLKRNIVYQITITDVYGPGENSERDAYKKGKLLLEISLNEWDRDEDELILQDGDNLLAIPTRKIIFGKEEEQRQFYVYTEGKGILELNYLEMPDGIKAWLGGDGNDLFVSVTDFTKDKRKGSFELRFAGMKGIIEVEQSGYMEKKLVLDHNNVPAWPAGIITGLPTESVITVTSSGPWSAEIFGGNFSFSYNNEIKTQSGYNGDKITSIYTMSTNSDIKSRNAFILVTLDEDPDNYRNVIVLTQSGTGGFTLTPENTSVFFNPKGELSLVSNNFNTFTVEPGELTDVWKVEILPNGEVWDNFKIEYDQNLNLQGNVVGRGSFTIKSEGPNYTGIIQAIARVIHNEVNIKNINITQDKFDFNLSHSSISGLKASGEITVPVSILTNLENGTWSASIESNLDPGLGLIPQLIDHNGNEVSVISSAGQNETFQVKMPGINKRINKAPIATITVNLDGTNLTRKLIVSQKEVEYVPIHVQSYRNSYGAFWDNLIYFNRWASEMSSLSNFGENGTVYSKGVFYGTAKNNVSYSDILSFSGVRIRVMNVNNPLNGYNNIGQSGWNSLKEDEYVVFMLSGHENRDNMFTFPGFTGYEYKKNSSRHSSSLTVDPDAKNKNPALWDYLFVNGPFGPVESLEVDLESYDDLFGVITNWPETFVPLIRNPQNQNEVIFGIDPKNRIIWIGETDIFSNKRNRFTNSYPDNLKFLQNVLAWMVNINNYGDAFQKDFINE